MDHGQLETRLERIKVSVTMKQQMPLAQAEGRNPFPRITCVCVWRQPAWRIGKPIVTRDVSDGSAGGSDRSFLTCVEGKDLGYIPLDDSRLKVYRSLLWLMSSRGN